jgi:hypothetical protein
MTNPLPEEKRLRKSFYALRSKYVDLMFLAKARNEDDTRLRLIVDCLNLVGDAISSDECSDIVAMGELRLGKLRTLATRLREHVDGEAAEKLEEFIAEGRQL